MCLIARVYVAPLDKLGSVGTDEVINQLASFVSERDWQQFHTPANLAKSIAIEAAELLECFQWDESSRLDEVPSELADVLTYCYLLSAKLGLDPNRLILEKLEESKRKYPVRKSKGRSDKYDRL